MALICPPGATGNITLQRRGLEIRGPGPHLSFLISALLTLGARLFSLMGTALVSPYLITAAQPLLQAVTTKNVSDKPRAPRAQDRAQKHPGRGPAVEDQRSSAQVQGKKMPRW